MFHHLSPFRFPRISLLPFPRLARHPRKSRLHSAKAGGWTYASCSPTAWSAAGCDSSKPGPGPPMSIMVPPTGSQLQGAVRLYIPTVFPSRADPQIRIRGMPAPKRCARQLPDIGSSAPTAHTKTPALFACSVAIHSRKLCSPIFIFVRISLPFCRL